MPNGNNTISFEALAGDKSVREAFAVRQIESIADSLESIVRILQDLTPNGFINVNRKDWKE